VSRVARLTTLFGTRARVVLVLSALALSACGSDDSPAEPDLPDTPSATEVTTPPVLINRAEVVAALEREYPQNLDVSARVVIWIRLDDRGAVQEVRIHTSSGYPEFDQAAIRIGGIMRFSPAQRDGRSVPVWVSIPITWTVVD